MRIFYLLSGTFFSLFFCTISFSLEAQGLPELLGSIRSLQSDFVQTIIDNRGKAVQQSKGKMALSRPGRFRWEVFHPVPQLIIANHSRLWIYDSDLQQVVVRPLGKTAGQTPIFLLSNMTNRIGDNFTVRRMSSPKNWQWFSLTPKQKNNMFNHIQLGFLNNEIKEMRLWDNLGHNTVIRLQNPKKNSLLPDSLFIFHRPANVDVIDETQ